MYRIKCKTWKGIHLTPDALNAIQKLEEHAYKTWGWRLICDQAPQKVLPSTQSLASAGREVYMRLEHPTHQNPQRALEALWGFAIPLGFTPWPRHPVLVGAAYEHVFHFLGPWQVVYDRMIAEGRGHLAWSSVRAAALSDVGAYAEPNKEGVFLQAQLHRVGQNPGAVDGVLGPRTAQAFQALELATGKRFTKAQWLAKLPTFQPPKQSSLAIISCTTNHQIQSFGEIQTIRSNQGAKVKINGPGRIVVDFIDPPQ